MTERRDVPPIPEEQGRVRVKCFHPQGTFVAFPMDAKSGDHVERIVAGFFRVDPTVVATLREILCARRREDHRRVGSFTRSPG